MVRCIPAQIFRSRVGGKDSDCSNSGISTRFDEVLVEAPDGYIDVDENNPPENYCKVGRIMGIYHCTPVGLLNKDAMFGGAFVATTDYRFPFDYPIMLFDRVE